MIKKNSRLLPVVAICVGLCAPAVLAHAQATLTIDVNQPKAPVSKTLYGLMTEEINYSYDGGVYAELIPNRTFRTDWTGILNWFVVEKGSSSAKISVDKTGPSAALSSSAKLEVKRADAHSPAGLLNEGYWGFAVRPNERFTGSLYAKTDAAEPLPVRVALIANQTGEVLATATSTVAGTEWKQYKFEMQSGKISAPSSENHFEITIDRPASLWLQMVSLFPPTYHGHPNGSRIDLMEKLAAMHPAFLRFPGGNYLEGDRIESRFEWKKMIGPLVERPTHPGTWSYHSSDGMGLLEFLIWCEDLKMEPVLGVYAGYSLGGHLVKVGADLETYVQEALEEIEYVTGGPDTKWGAIRARDGHPAPFHLRYVEIGNEDNFDKVRTYDGRYSQFYKAIKAKYPDLQLIATMPVKGITPDIVDDHYYKREQGMFAEARHYDTVDRKGPKVFVGEWATREGLPTTNMGAALGDAAFMTGLERNSDIVIMAAYAPLLVNVNPGGMQWSSDLIGYNAMSSYGSPSYYAQSMFAACLGDQTVQSNTSGTGDRFFYSVTKSADKLCLKLVNASSDEQPIEISLNGAGAGSHAARVETLKGNTIWATNSITHPDRILPVKSTTAIKGDHLRHVLPGYSIQVLEVDLR